MQAAGVETSSGAEILPSGMADAEISSTLRDWERAELELLFDIARTFDKYVELRTALGPLLSLMEFRAGLGRGMVTLLDRATGVLKVEEAFGLNAEEKRRGVYRLGEGLVGRVFETGSPITVPDLAKDPRFLNRAGNRRREDMEGLSYYCVPIRSRGSVIGTLSAERRIREEDPRRRMAWDRSFLEKVSSIISDSAKLRERIMEEQFRLHREEADSLGDNADWAQGGRIAPESGIIGTSSSMR
jgi:Nif-specific regulatory protein